MALSRSKLTEIPKDAVVLTEDQALTYNWKIIAGWEKTGDVWALKYSSSVVGTCAALSGIFVNNHYRRKLKLGSYGKFSTYLPIVVIPAIFTVLAHKFFVQRSILLNPLGECPLCIQLRAASFQSALGVVYPTILAPFAAFMFATRHYTYRLPSITEKPLEVLHLWRSMTRPIVPTLGAIILGQSLITMYLTYKQAEQNIRLQVKLQQLEKRIDHGEENIELLTS